MICAVPKCSRHATFTIMSNEQHAFHVCESCFMGLEKKYRKYRKSEEYKEYRKARWLSV